MRKALPERAGGWLAPMAGVTDPPFRLLCLEQGCAATCTEMVPAQQIIACGAASPALAALMEPLPGERPALQLFSPDPAAVAEAVGRMDLSPYRALDLNMGCPARKIVGNAEGAALMRDIPRAALMVQAAAVRSPIPVTVKMRAGWDEQERNAVAFARAMQDAGASALAVHGRTRMQQYAGRADWGLIGEVKAAVRIPVIGNGDVTDGPSALRMLRETGVDAVMVGRGALGNPWVFREIACALRGQEAPPVTPAERIQLAIRHTGLLVARKGERIAVPEMRKHVAWTLHGLRGAAWVRRRVNEARGLEELLRLLHEYAGELAKEETT